jgi:hypothetical protein
LPSGLGGLREINRKALFIMARRACALISQGDRFHQRFPIPVETITAVPGLAVFDLIGNAVLIAFDLIELRGEVLRKRSRPRSRKGLGAQKQM